MKKVFISYAKEDIILVEEIYDLLLGQAHEVWIDSKNLVGGQEWKIEIEKAIRTSDVFIACLSSVSVSKSGYVQKELRTALDVAESMPEGRIYIIPIRLDECDVPTRLKNLHWVNYFEQDGHDKLLRAVEGNSKESGGKETSTKRQHLNSESENGPCLYSVKRVFRRGYDPNEWVANKYKLILWCEHSTLPLYILDNEHSQNGVYEFEVPHEWLILAAPHLKFLYYALLYILPLVYVSVRLALSDEAFKSIENQLIAGSITIGVIMLFGIRILDSILMRKDKVYLFVDLDKLGPPIYERGAKLRQLHAFLKDRDPGFGGLIRVMNKQREFLWVHEKFTDEY